VIYTRRDLHETQKLGIYTETTGMSRITTFRSTTDRIYDGGPIRL